jgi:signal transduction histidine kinase
MTDAERVLHVLLHDLRTPIGVAQGYLRMLQDGRMTSTADTARAITKALEALGQTGRLCQSASDFLEAPDGHPRTTSIAADKFAEQVELTARNQSLVTHSGRIHASARLALAGDVARLSEAVVLVLSTAGGKRGTLQVESDENELRFVATDGPNSSMPSLTPFDGWSQGLPLAVACRRIEWSSGQVLKFETGSGLIVTFPLKAGTGRDGTV